jgi:hypothetical protein
MARGSRRVFSNPIQIAPLEDCRLPPQSHFQAYAHMAEWVSCSRPPPPFLSSIPCARALGLGRGRSRGVDVGLGGGADGLAGRGSLPPRRHPPMPVLQ